MQGELKHVLGIALLLLFTTSSVGLAYSFHPRHETGNNSLPYVYTLNVPVFDLLPVNSTSIIIPVNTTGTTCVSIGGSSWLYIGKVAWIDLTTGNNSMSVISRSTSCNTNKTLTGFYVDQDSNAIILYGGMNKTPFITVVLNPTVASIKSGSINVKEYEVQLPAVRVLSASYSNGIVVFATDNVTSGDYQGYMLVGYINTNNGESRVYAFKLVNPAVGSSRRPVSVSYADGKIVIVTYRSISLLDLTTGTITSYVISGIPSGNPYDFETYTNGSLVYYAERGTYSGNYQTYVFIGHVSPAITGSLYEVPTDQFTLIPYGVTETNGGYIVYVKDGIFNLTSNGGEAYEYKYQVSTDKCTNSVPDAVRYYKVIRYGNFTLATQSTIWSNPILVVSYKGVETSIEKTISFQASKLTPNLEEASNVIETKSGITNAITDESSRISVMPSSISNPLHLAPICTWNYSLSFEAYSPTLINKTIAGYYLGPVNRVVLGRTIINPVLMGYNNDVVITATSNQVNYVNLASMSLVNISTSSLPESVIQLSQSEYSIVRDAEAFMVTSSGQVTGVYTEYTSNGSRYDPLLIAPFNEYVIVGDVNRSANPPVVLLSVFNRLNQQFIAGYKIQLPQGAYAFTTRFTAGYYNGEPLVAVSGYGFYNNQAYGYVLLMQVGENTVNGLLVKIPGATVKTVLTVDGSNVYLVLSTSDGIVILRVNPGSGSVAGYSYNLDDYGINIVGSVYVNDSVIVLSGENGLAFIEKDTMNVYRVITLSSQSSGPITIKASFGGSTTPESAIGGYYHYPDKNYDLVLYWNKDDNAELLVRLEAFTKVFPVSDENTTITPTTITPETSSITPQQGYTPAYTIKTETLTPATGSVSEIDSSDYTITKAKAVIKVNAPPSITGMITSMFTINTTTTQEDSVIIPLDKEANITAYVTVSGRKLIVSRIAVRPPVLVSSRTLESAIMKDNPRRLEVILSSPSTIVFITTTVDVEGVVKDSSWFIKSSAKGLGKITIWNGDYKVFVFDPSNTTILLSSNSTSNNSTGSTIGESSRSSRYLGGIAVTVGSVLQVIVLLLTLFGGIVLVIYPAWKEG